MTGPTAVNDSLIPQLRSPFTVPEFTPRLRTVEPRVACPPRARLETLIRRSSVVVILIVFHDLVDLFLFFFLVRCQKVAGPIMNFSFRIWNYGNWKEPVNAKAPSGVL